MEVVGPIIGVMVFVSVAGGVVYALARGRVGGAGINFAAVLSAYAALMTAIAVLIMAAGAASLVKAGLSELGGRDFSYNTLRFGPLEPPALPPSGRTDATPRSDPAVADRQLREDIADGITFLAVGAAVLLIHYGLETATRRRVVPWLQRNIDRALKLVLTAIGGVGFLIAGGIGLSGWLRRTVLETELQPGEVPPHPGGALAWAMVWLLLWAVFGLLLWREFVTDKDQPEPA